MSANGLCRSHIGVFHGRVLPAGAGLLPDV